MYIQKVMKHKPEDHSTATYVQFSQIINEGQWKNKLYYI